MMFFHLDHWKNNKSLLLAMLLVVPQAFAQTNEDSFLKDQLGVSGSLRGSFWNRDKSYSDERNYAVGSAWLNLRPQEIAGFKVFADAYVQGQDLSRDNYSEVDLRELYVEKSFGNFDLKLGRAITVWGRADKLNPTDSLSVRNFKKLMTDDEDQRTGVTQALLTYNWQTIRITGVWAPEWRSPVYPIPPITGVRLTDQKPEQSEKQWALKLDQSSSFLDWSVSYFSGYNKLPDLRLISANASGTTIGLNYGEIKTWGADFAKTIGDYGVRGEIAYTKTADDKGLDPLLQNSQLYAVVGIEHSFFENMNLNVQFLHKYVFDFQRWENLPLGPTRILAQQTAINSNQVAENQSGLSLRPSYKMWNDTLEMEVAAVVWFHNSNGLIRPKITYSLSDQWRWIIGGEFYHGPNDSFFGRLHPTSTGFTELRWLF